MKTLESDFLENVKCPICQTEDYRVVIKSRHPDSLNQAVLSDVYRSSSEHDLMDQMVLCNNCDLFFLSPRIKSDMIIDAYKEHPDERFLEQNTFRIKTFTKIFKKLIRQYRWDPDHHTKILDIGCAAGAFLKAARDLGFEVDGIEPNRWLCEQGRALYDLNLKHGILRDYHYEARSIHIVTMWDVIEHLTDPAYELKRIHAFLTDDGYLIVNYPDYNSLARKILGKKWPFFLNAHLFYFTPKTITRLLEKCGFKVVSISPFWQTLALGYAFKRASARFKVFSFMERWTKKLNFYHWPLTYNMGQTTVVAKKN